MINASRLHINILSFIITFILVNTIYITKENINFTMPNILQEKENIHLEKNNNKELEKNTNEKILTQEISYNWGIAIPKINLNAQISEGTSKEVMDKYVGHFSDTGIIKGNICLGAHNRGYNVNYFENIKNLQEGDLIFYKKEEKQLVFKVETVTVIKDTDWTYLEETSDNRITLITCVENEPDYRRCIQGIEYKGGN